MEGVLQIEKEIEKEKQKEKEIAALKVMVESLQRQLTATKNLPELPETPAVSEADAPEPTAGAMEQPSTSHKDKIRK